MIWGGLRATSYQQRKEIESVSHLKSASMAADKFSDHISLTSCHGHQVSSTGKPLERIPICSFRSISQGQWHSRRSAQMHSSIQPYHMEALTGTWKMSDWLDLCNNQIQGWGGISCNDLHRAKECKENGSRHVFVQAILADVATLSETCTSHKAE